MPYGEDPHPEAAEVAMRVRIKHLEDEVVLLREALSECAVDLEAEVEEHYRHSKEYPGEKRRYERGIAPVRKAYELLGRNHHGHCRGK